MKLDIKHFLSKFIFVTVLSGSILSLEPKIANADFSSLTPCKDSPAFKKRLTTTKKDGYNSPTISLDKPQS